MKYKLIASNNILSSVLCVILKSKPGCKPHNDFRSKERYPVKQPYPHTKPDNQTGFFSKKAKISSIVLKW